MLGIGRESVRENRCTRHFLVVDADQTRRIAQGPDLRTELDSSCSVDSKLRVNSKTCPTSDDAGVAVPAVSSMLQSRSPIGPRHGPLL